MTRDPILSAGFSRPRRWTGVMTLLALGTVGLAAEPPAGPVITPSKATTHFTEPLDAAGYVDFVAAVNRELGRGVTPDENATIPLLQAMGPCERNLETVNQVLRALGAKPWSPGMPDFQSIGEVAPSAGIPHEKLNADSNATHRGAWTSADYPVIAASLAANAEPLALIAAAVQRPKYYRPLLPGKPDGLMITVLLSDVQSYREVARQLWSRALLHLGEGRPLEARQDLLTMHRLGRHVGSGGTLIEGLVGIAIDAVATSADTIWAAHPSVTADHIAEYRRLLTTLPPPADLVRATAVTERASCLDVVQAMARGRMSVVGEDLNSTLGFTDANAVPSGKWLDAGQLTKALMVFSVDWNVVMQTVNRQFDDLAHAAEQPDRRQRIALLESFDQQLKATQANSTTFKGVFTNLVGGSNSRGKTFGHVLAGMLIPAVKAAMTAQDRAAARSDLRQVMLALSEHQRREGAFPATLSALTPKYLDEVPRDVFSGQPFRYQTDGVSYRLYSLGQNGRDDDGQLNAQGADDILLSYPPPSQN
jgi:hypothetical protein